MTTPGANITPAWSMKIGCLFLIGACACSNSYGQTPPVCAKEQKLVALLDQQLQTAHDNLQKSTCAGSARTVCQDQIKSLQQQIAGAQAYIRSGCPPPKSVPPPPPSPFDLISDNLDPNQLLLDPIWGWQQSHPGQLTDPAICGGKPWQSPCTSQSTYIDNSSWKCPTGALNGHANWAPATYTGTLYWSEHSSDDDDYNIMLYRTDNAALTVHADKLSAAQGGAPAMLMEFDSDETIDHFHTQWWKDFHAAVDKGDSAARQMIDGKDGVAIGILGLDYAHSGGTELHPVFGLAIHVTDDLNADTWAIFVRNRGNEGYCSSGAENLIATTISFLIPNAAASNVELVSSDFLFGPDSMSAADKAQVSGPNVTLLPGKGALVTFTLPGPNSGPRMNGSLQLKWTVSAYPVRRTTIQRPNAGTHTAIATETAPDPEEAVRNELNGLTPSQSAAYLRLFPPPAVSYDSGIPKSGVMKTAPSPQKAPTVQHVADPARDARDLKQSNALKQALTVH
jgi:hypothetical protein